jgi:hypothetical protein
MIQTELPLARRADVPPVSEDTVMRRKDFLGAINLCIDISGLDDKEIYLELGIDPGQWSRIRKGDAHFPPNKLQSLMTVCGNQVPLIWLARQYGYELVQIESETQRLLRAEREARIEAEKKLAYAESLLRGGR